MKILICEDDNLLQRTLQILLGKNGFDLIQAFDGNQAFEYLNNEHFDMLLVDIHLPYSNGIEIIEYYRHTLKKDSPVLIVTAIDNKRIKEQAEKLDILDYIIKPFDPKALVSLIQNTLNA